MGWDGMGWDGMGFVFGNIIDPGGRRKVTSLGGGGRFGSAKCIFLA